MKVQDFFSIVQLGVGIHVGTAILQLSGEFGLAPLERRLETIATWLREERESDHILADHEEDLRDIQSSISIFKMQYAREYRFLIIIMSGAAGILTFALAVMSFAADFDISPIFGVILVALSFLPAAGSFAYLWDKSREGLVHIKRSVERMEALLMAPQAARPQRDPNIGPEA